MPRQRPTLPIGRPAYALRAPDGASEFAISRAAGSRLSRPDRVTAVLAAALATVEGEPATLTLVRRLSSGTREWLLQQIGALFRPRQDWLQGHCSACGAAYDLNIELADLPVKATGKHFPLVTLRTSLGRRSFEVPNGADEEMLVRLGGNGDPRRQLVALCGLADTASEDALLFTDADLDRIDAALDAAALQPSDRSVVTCPDCGAESDAVIDPVAFAFPRELAVLSEVHRIAAAYHWSEEAILALPSRRRRQYLSLIARSRQGGRR